MNNIGSKVINGKEYLEYDVDTFDYICTENSWVFANNAIEEQSWILDHMCDMLESEDGETILIPAPKIKRI